MSLKIVPSVRQPFEAGSRVVFSMEGDDSCSDRVRPESIPMERRKCHWKAIRLSGPPVTPTGFEVPTCFEPTVTVEFPVEPGEWLLTATNSRRESFALRYSVGGFPVKAVQKKPVKFRDLDPEVVLGRMRVASSGLDRIESKFRCKPEVAEHTAVASNHSSIDQELSRDSLKNSIENLDRLLAKSRGERRWALRAVLTPGGAANLGKAKARELHVFASRINGVWSITDWTSLGRAGAATIYASPRIRYEEWSKANRPATIAEDLHGAFALWCQRWPYEEGYLTIEGVVDGMAISERMHIETPGKDAAKLAGFLDAVSMIAMFVGFVVPGLMLVSMAAGAGASVVRLKENARQGKDESDNLLDVLFLVASATSVGKMAVGAASGMSRVASVATQVKGKSITYMTWADDLANGACFVMMTPEVYDLTTETLSDETLTASQKLERLATGLMPYVVTGGILIHNVGGKRLVNFGRRVLDEMMTVRPTELLPVESHTNERTNRTKVGRRKNSERYERLDEPETKERPPSEEGKPTEAPQPKPEMPLNQYAVDNTLNFMHPEDSAYKNIMRRETSDVNPGGVFDFVGHGSEFSVGIDNLMKKPGAPDGVAGRDWYESRTVSPENFAKILLSGKTSYKKGQEIRLLSCSTGKNPEGFAQKLANILNVKVHAPTDILWVGPDGKYVVSSGVEIVDPVTKKARKAPKQPPDGEFKHFAPEENGIGDGIK